MNEIKEFSDFLEIAIDSLWVASDAIAKAYLNFVGIFFLVVAFVTFLGLEGYFTKNTERAKFGSVLIGFLIFCPFWNLLFFGGNSYENGDFTFLYVFTIVTLYICSRCVFYVWEKKIEKSALQDEILEDNKEKQTEKEFQEQSVVETQKTVLQEDCISSAQIQIVNSEKVICLGSESGYSEDEDDSDIMYQGLSLFFNYGNIDNKYYTDDKSISAGSFVVAYRYDGTVGVALVLGVSPVYGCRVKGYRKIFGLATDEQKETWNQPFEAYRPYDNKLKKEDNVSSRKDDLVRFAAVKFPNSDKTYDYLCDDCWINSGDIVVVPNRGGTKRAAVESTFYKRMEEMPLPSYRYKKIIGIADNILDYDEDDWDGYCVDVKFNATGRNYSYRCPFQNVSEDDFVLVRAKGEVTTAKVVRKFYDPDARWSMVLAKATWEQKNKVEELFEEDDEKLSWEEEEEFRRDMEEDKRRRALEEKEELREIRLEQKRQVQTALEERRRTAEILAYQRGYAMSSSYSDDGWQPSQTNIFGDEDEYDGNRIFDKHGNMINGKLLEYERKVRETGVADNEYRQELMDGYTYCDEHEEYE